MDSFFSGAKIYPNEDRKEEEKEEKIGRKEYHKRALRMHFENFLSLYERNGKIQLSLQNREECLYSHLNTDSYKLFL
jgi:hypothetical protein